MACSGLRGHTPLTTKGVNDNVARTSPGAYALGRMANGSMFLISYVGRSDKDVNARLHDHVRGGAGQKRGGGSEGATGGLVDGDQAGRINVSQPWTPRKVPSAQVEALQRESTQLTAKVSDLAKQLAQARRQKRRDTGELAAPSSTPNVLERTGAKYFQERTIRKGRLKGSAKPATKITRSGSGKHCSRTGPSSPISTASVTPRAANRRMSRQA